MLLCIVFGIFAIGLLGILFGNFTLQGNREIAHWNKYGYTIYLWQNISFWIYSLAYGYFGIGNWLEHYPVADFLITALGIFIISTLTSFLAVPLEHKLLSLLPSFAKKEKKIKI